MLGGRDNARALSSASTPVEHRDHNPDESGDVQEMRTGQLLRSLRLSVLRRESNLRKMQLIYDG